jgi:hypothetical protein
VLIMGAGSVTKHDVYAFLMSFLEKHGRAPEQAEFEKALKSSWNAIRQHMLRLRRRGRRHVVVPRFLHAAPDGEEAEGRQERRGHEDRCAGRCEDQREAARSSRGEGEGTTVRA